MSVSPNATNQRLPHIDALAEVCRQLRLIGVQFMEAKKDSPADFQRTLPDLLTQSNHLFVALKTLNRQTYNHTRATKQATTDAKLQMDRQQLGLQNFHYERRHLEKEIRKCEEFDSIYQDINLVPQEDFLGRAPAELTSTTDPHQLMINQLDFELSERLRLEKEQSDLHELQSKLLNENKHAKAELEKLDGELEQFLKGSIQLQEALKIPIEATRKQSDAARLLPMPLFVLFRHALGYSEAFDHTIIVDIQGDTIAAASFLQVQSTPPPSSSLASQSQQTLSVPPSISIASALLAPKLTNIRDSAAQSSSDPGTPRPNHDRDDDDSGSTAKKHKARHGTMPTDQYYKRHPLEVVITINKDDSPQSHPILKLRFAHLPNLNIVTVAPEECAGILYLDKRDMLANLLPGDTGTDSPNPANQFLSNGDDPFEFDPTQANGHAYHWAQHTCGLDFASTPPQQQDVVGKWTAEPGTPRRPYLAKLIELVRVRRRGWKQLERQLEALQKLNIQPLRLPSPPSTSLISPPPADVRLVQWKDAEPEMVQPRTKCYVALFHGEPLKFEAVLTIDLAYPDHAPQFELSFAEVPRVSVGDLGMQDASAPSATTSMDSETQDSTTTGTTTLQSHLKAIEKEVNDPAATLGQLSAEFDRSMVLTLQITKLVACLKVLVDAVKSKDADALDKATDLYTMVI